MRDPLGLNERLFARWYPIVVGFSERAGARELRRDLFSEARGRTLEIGAGSGLNIPHYTAAVSELVVSEPSPHMREHLRALLASDDAPPVGSWELVDAGAQELPFEDASFDTVTGGYVFCTIPDPPAALRELARVLKPGGRFIFLEHVHAGEGTALGRVQDALEVPHRYIAAGCYPNRRWRQILADSPFEVESLEEGTMPRGLPTVRPIMYGSAVAGLSTVSIEDGSEEGATRVSERVHERLRAQILAGKLAPGDPVPSERGLAEELSVGRHAVREALKRLEQAGLVRISQGGATRVLDWRESGGLELLLDLFSDTSEMPPPELTRSVLEMRATIGVDAARRAAERASDAERAEVSGAAERAADAITEGGAGVLEAYVALWRAVVVGSGNVTYRLALNSLNAAIAERADVAAALNPREPGPVAALGEAIEARDGAAAARAAAALLEPDVAALG